MKVERYYKLKRAIDGNIRKSLSTFFFPLVTYLLLTSCSELLYLSVEQMIPPEITFEHARQRVGIVNNFSQHNIILVNEDTQIYPCNPDSVKEQIALSFANAGIFDRVVVLDSLLYPIDSITPHILSQTEVNNLCAQLEVDWLYSLDYACAATYSADPTTGRPINAYLCSRIYTPDTDSISGSATLDKKTVERWSYGTEELHHLIPQIPYLLAEKAIEPYLTTWKERERVFYHNRLCYELREAKVYVYENNWEAAAEQWRKLSTHKLRNRRFEAAYNMALYYEMTDSIDQAITTLEQAKALATETDKGGNSGTLLIDTDYVDQYYDVLLNRRKEIEQLKHSYSHGD